MHRLHANCKTIRRIRRLIDYIMCKCLFCIIAFSSIGLTIFLQLGLHFMSWLIDSGLGLKRWPGKPEVINGDHGGQPFSC